MCGASLPPWWARRLNGIAATSPEGLAAITADGVVTTAAGLLFPWLCWRSHSLLAPVLAHWATAALGPARRCDE